MSEQEKKKVTNRDIVKYMGIAFLVVVSLLTTYYYMQGKEFKTGDFGEIAGVPTFERVPLVDESIQTNNTQREHDGTSIDRVHDTIGVLLGDETFVAMGFNGTRLLFTESRSETLFVLQEYTLTDKYDLDTKHLSQSLYINDSKLNATSYLRVNFPIAGDGFNVDGVVFTCPVIWDISTCHKVIPIE